MSIKQHLEAFLKHADDLRKTDGNALDGYEKGFRRIRDEAIQCKADGRYPATEALKEVNVKKNRFRDIAPYDYTRVRLDEREGVPGSDYINANFIKGVNGKATYIASQGPLPHTTTDFWRMLWKYDIYVVMMVCRETELDRPRCHRYWPNEGETLQFDDISVTLIEENHPDPDNQFVFRQLQAVHNGATRTIHHLHFLAWPDRYVPSEVTHVIDLLAKAREFQTRDVPPVVIHCSAGCGRTGSLIVIDYVWNLLKAGKLSADFSLFDIIKTMRTQRPSIVQSEEQYFFVHKAVEFLFKEHLDLLSQHFYENTTTDDATSDNNVYANVGSCDNVYEDVGIRSSGQPSAVLSCPSLRIIQNTVKELVTSQNKESATGMPGSDPSEKPNILTKPDSAAQCKSDVFDGVAMSCDVTKNASRISSGGGINPESDDVAKCSDSAKTRPRRQEQYENVTLRTSETGVKPVLEASKHETSWLAERPPVPVPKTRSLSNESHVYSEVTEEKATQDVDREYSYADPKRLGKWSLQHIALGQPPPDASLASPTDDGIYWEPDSQPTTNYTSDGSYESDGPDVTQKKVDAKAELPGKLTDVPRISPVLTWVFDKKVIYHGIDISFPNRVKKPIGPRRMPFAVKH